MTVAISAASTVTKVQSVTRSSSSPCLKIQRALTSSVAAQAMGRSLARSVASLVTKLQLVGRELRDGHNARSPAEDQVLDGPGQENANSETEATSSSTKGHQPIYAVWH